MLVHRRARRLHDEDVGPPDVLVDLERDLRVWKPMKPRAPPRNVELLGDLSRERWMRTSSEELELPVTHVSWLGRKDSNLRIRDPKSRALPLGHAPARSS